MQFEHNTYLFLLLALPVFLLIYALAAFLRKKRIKNFGEAQLIYQLMPKFSARMKFIKFTLLLLAFACFCFALANLRMGSKREKITAQSSEIVLCFDVSRSMLAEDIKPDRLTRAKILASQIIQELAGNKISLVVFAGKSYVQMPLTVDVRSALLYLNTVNTDMIDIQGTDIGGTISTALQVFENGGDQSENKKNNKAIILISDGEGHDEQGIEMAKKAAEQNIKIITIGVGTANGGPIPVKRGSSVDYKKDKEGNIILTKLNEPALKEIADAGNGEYRNLSDGKNVLSMVKQQVGELDKDEAGEFEFTDYKNHFQIFLLAGILLLVLEFLLSDKRPDWVEKIQLFKARKTE